MSPDQVIPPRPPCPPLPPPPPPALWQMPPPPPLPTLPRPVLAGPYRLMAMPSPFWAPRLGGASRLVQPYALVPSLTKMPPRLPAESAEMRPLLVMLPLARKITMPPVAPSHG